MINDIKSKFLKVERERESGGIYTSLTQSRVAHIVSDVGVMISTDPRPRE